VIIHLLYQIYFTALPKTVHAVMRCIEKMMNYVEELSIWISLKERFNYYTGNKL